MQACMPTTSGMLLREKKKGRQNPPDTNGASLLGPAKISLLFNNRYTQGACMRFTVSKDQGFFSERQVTV